MARPKPPNKILDLKGDPNKNRRLPDGIEIDKLTERPNAPDWLSGRALNNFNEYCDLLIPLGLVTENDIKSLAMFSWLESKMIKLILAEETPSMSMMSQYKSFLGEWGLTALSREKMRGSTETKTANKFAKKEPPKRK